MSLDGIVSGIKNERAFSKMRQIQPQNGQYLRWGVEQTSFSNLVCCPVLSCQRLFSCAVRMCDVILGTHVWLKVVL